MIKKLTISTQDKKIIVPTDWDNFTLGMWLDIKKSGQEFAGTKK